MKQYRVAMVGLELAERPECHILHFVPFMEDCDPLVLLKVYPSIYHWFTKGQYDKFHDGIRRVDGFQITKIWDIQSTSRAADIAKMIRRGPKVCEKIEQTWDDVDAAFIADGGGDGSLHLEYATPFLERKIPVFVDKPFALQYKDAKAMVDLAIKHDTPLMSCSILSHVDQIKHFQNRWGTEIPQPGLAIVKGYGPSPGAIIHTLALAQGMFGLGVQWVECMGTPPPEALAMDMPTLAKYRPFKPGTLPLEVMMLGYKDGRQALVVNTVADVHDNYSCEVWGNAKRINPPPPIHLRSPDIGNAEFIAGTYNILCLFKQMLDERKPPIPYEVPLELIAILDAGIKANITRKRVYLKDIMK